MRENETSVKADEAISNLLHEFALHLLSKMEEMIQHAVILERLIRDIGILA